MDSRFTSSVSFLSILSLAASQTVQFDGRIPSGTALSAFDADNAFFNSGNVVGQNLTFSQVLQLPEVQGSIFDQDTVPLEVTINDQSIFAPSADNVQIGFRRCELIPASNDGTDASTTGVKTLHFSLMKDTARPLNLSHEYQLVFLESNDFSTNQVVLKTGTVLGQDVADPDTLMLFSNVNDASLLFSTKFTEGTFHNFGVTLDFDANTTQVFYSTGSDPLAQVTDAVANDVSGQGQFHFGMLKKPIGGGDDITKSGFQPAGIDEGIIYAGIFQEDSAGGVVTKSLAGATSAAGSNETDTGAAAGAGASSKCKRRAPKDVVRRRSQRARLGHVAV